MKLEKIKVEQKIIYYLTESKKKTANNENKQNMIQTHLHQETPTNNILHSGMHNQQQSNITSINNHSVNHQLSWTCELCGRMFANREEWSIHAKSHLEVRFNAQFLAIIK